MKNNIILRLVQTAFAVLVPFAVSGQNLNPTVEVSKEYEGKLMEARKPGLKMAVPDTVYRFNLDFDYSVVETPYRGSYEFNPYSVEMTVSPVVRDVKYLYLKAGIGYQMHPELDFVWSPRFRKPLRMNVYASHESFAGKYWKMALSPNMGSSLEVNRVGKDAEGGRTWFGYDLASKAGVQGRYDWEKLLFRFDVECEGLQQKVNPEAGRSFLAVDAKTGVFSKYTDSGIEYKIGLGYRYGEDRASGPADALLRENDFDLDVSVGYVLENGHRVALGFDAAVVGTSGFISSGGTDVDVLPRYLIETERWKLDLGVRFSVSANSTSKSDFYDMGGQLFYPDARVECRLVTNVMNVYLDLGGDSNVDSYSDVLNYNRRADMFYGRGQWKLLGVSEERINAAFGIEGRIGSRFSYDVRGGYVSVGSALLDGLTQVDGMLMPAVGYASYDKLYGAVDWLFDCECFRFDGCFEYTNVNDGYEDDKLGLFLPPSLRSEASVRYNWKRRVFVGVDCEYSSYKVGRVFNEGSYAVASVPSYVDLGLSAEYAINRKLSAWLKGGNLLGMTIQRNLLYAEKGPYFTAGICLNL